MPASDFAYGFDNIRTIPPSDRSSDVHAFHTRNVEPVELDAEFVEHAVRRLEILIRTGRFEIARKAIDDLESTWQKQELAKLGGRALNLFERLRSPISELGLGPRLVNTLEEHGIENAGQLAQAWPRIYATNLGVKGLFAIGDALLHWGVISVESRMAGIKWIFTVTNSGRIDEC